MNQVLPEWTNDHNGPYILGCEMAIVSSKVRFLLDNWTFLRIISVVSPFRFYSQYGDGKGYKTDGLGDSFLIDSHNIYPCLQIRYIHS